MNRIDMKNFHRIRFGLLSLALLVPALCISQEKFIEMKKTDEFRHQLGQATKQVSSVTSNFIQEKNLSVISEKIISKGNFLFKKEKKLRWEYTDPFTYLIIFRDDKIFIKDETKANQFDVHSNKLFAEINRIMIGSIQGTLLSDDKNFKPAYFESSRNFLVKLKPVLPGLKQFLDEIWIYFDKLDYTVSRLEMRESSGDYTKIDFLEKKLNEPIPDEKFNFK